MRNLGKVGGLILIIAGLSALLIFILWLGAGMSAGKYEDLAAPVLGFGLFFLVLVVPLTGGGVFLLIKGRQEAAELAEVEKERAVLNMVQAQGQVRVADVALELDITLDQVRVYIHDLVGKGLFSGYINWDEGLLYSRDAAQLRGNTCPNCGGELELAGKGVVRCPYCGSEVFLS
ncbi:MAG: hypothetical protein U9Q78_05765 [Chloroflexota bacterium]|nr:hypothetical protein [Chloroflexota bacterium]